MILTSFILFTGLVAVLTWFITRKDDLTTNDGYFLAGRSLTFPLIAGSLLLTNLSTEQMVGLNADAFTNGLAVMVWEVAAVISLVFMAIFLTEIPQIWNCNSPSIFRRALQQNNTSNM